MDFTETQEMPEEWIRSLWKMNFSQGQLPRIKILIM
jgi:hypothetical protein